jgi:ectoine hydroxylase-related dioxygenase (phytanoyl-CoA dioxygenase family)
MSLEIISPEQKSQYERDGYLIVKNFLDNNEVDLLYGLASGDNTLRSHAFDLNDQSGKSTKLTLWFTPGDDTFGLLTRSERMVKSAQALLGEGEVCHFHSKLMQKEPRVGGAWEVHQDYGYWYKNGFLFPDAMLSIMLALTKATKENGCLQVLKGSHKMGRIEHNFAGEQQGADPAFVEEAMKTFERIYVELDPGDALFFHSNLLHMSEANLSDKPRWSLISVYNLSFNKPFREKNTSCFTPVKMAADDAFMQTQPSSLSNEADFLRKDQEITLNVK